MDRSFIELNRASQERMRTLAGRLTDEELQTRVGQHWTVGIVYAHIAWWDRRVMYVLDMTEKDNKLFIPEIDIFVNDLSLPLWAAVPPREAVRIAMETAETLDKRLEDLSRVAVWKAIEDAGIPPRDIEAARCLFLDYRNLKFL